MWHIINAENKILKYIQILAARKNQADREIPVFTENQADWEILAFAKNQADWEILAFTENQADLRRKKSLHLQKNRRIWEILASTEKQGNDRILAGVGIPASGKKTHVRRKTGGTGKAGGPLTV
jgi:hypothetical protein